MATVSATSPAISTCLRRNGGPEPGMANDPAMAMATWGRNRSP